MVRRHRQDDAPPARIVAPLETHRSPQETRTSMPRVGRPTYYKKVRPLRVAITEAGWLKILALMRKLKCSQADAVCAAMETVKIEEVRLPDP